MLTNQFIDSNQLHCCKCVLIWNFFVYKRACQCHVQITCTCLCLCSVWFGQLSHLPPSTSSAGILFPLSLSTASSPTSFWLLFFVYSDEPASGPSSAALTTTITLATLPSSRVDRHGSASVANGQKYPIWQPDCKFQSG